MPITHRDIAESLGISRQAVGFALNGNGNVSQEMRQRIQRAAEELGYSPEANHAARVLIGRRYGQRVLTYVIGCSFTSPIGQRLPYNIHLQEGVEAVARTQRLDVLLLNPEQNSSGGGWDKLDGILFQGHNARSAFPNLPENMPLVSLMVPGGTGYRVLADEAQGLQQAMEHLLGLGHRRIAYLIDTQPYDTQLNGRLSVYRTFLKDAGVEPDPRWVENLLPDNQPFIERGRHSMRVWLRNGWKERGCTALLVQNDLAAIGAMEILREADIRIPEDLSVIGFDSTDECDICHPSLTSVKVPLFEIGKRAAELLLQQIRNEVRQPETVILSTCLEIRGSTGPVSVGANLPLKKVLA